MDALNEGKVAAMNALAMRVPYLKINFSYYNLLGLTFFRTGDLRIADEVKTIGDLTKEHISFYMNKGEVVGVLSCGKKYNRWNLILR